MASYGEPDWTSPSGTANVTSQEVTGSTTINGGNPTTTRSSGGQNYNAADDRENARLIIATLSLLDIVLAAGMTALGVLTIIKFKPSSFDDLTQPFLGAYMIVFGCLLAIYEIIWWQPIASLNKTFRKNFGFLYGLRGKGLYLVCIAFLCLGVVNENATTVKGLDWATGFGWLACGCLHVFLGLWWPEANDVYRPPSAGLTDPSGSFAAPANPGVNNFENTI